MKNIIIKEINIEGFGSFVKPLNFKIKEGFYFVKGLNGSGKTSLFNAMYWCLYGKNLKNLKKEELVSKESYRGYDWNGTRVILSLSVNDKDYEIARHIDYKNKTKGLSSSNNVLIFENDILLNKYVDIKEKNQFIINLLNVDSKLFLNSVMFGQRMRRFMECETNEKKVIFENIFNLSFIDRSQNNAKLEKEKIDKKNVQYENDILLMNKDIESLKKLLNVEKEIKNSFDERKKEHINELSERIIELDDKISIIKIKNKNINDEVEKIDNEISKYKRISIDDNNLNDLINNKYKILKSIDKIDKEIIDIDFNERLKEKDIDDLKIKIKALELEKININDKCITCHQNIPENEINRQKKLFDNQINDIKIIIKENNKKLIEQKNINEKIKEEYCNTKTKYEKEIDNIKEKIDKCETISKEINEKEKENELRKQTIKFKNDNIIDNNKQIISILNEKSSTEQKIISIKNKKYNEDKEKELQNKLKSNEDKLCLYKKNLNKILEEKELIEFWLKKGFASNGLKSFIINNTLRTLNEALKKYTNSLGFNINIFIDVTKASKPFVIECYKSNRTKYSYDEFSGGEKAKIDIVIAFAIHDIVNAKSNFNIIVLDEIFENIDENGIDDLFDIIDIKSKNKSLYIISHSEIENLNCKNIYIKKENNNSFIL